MKNFFFDENLFSITNLKKSINNFCNESFFSTLFKNNYIFFEDFLGKNHQLEFKKKSVFLCLFDCKLKYLS